MYLPVLFSLVTALFAVGAAVLYSADAQGVTTDQPVVDATETIVAQGLFSTCPTTTVKVFVEGLISLTPGGTMTALVMNLRRGATITSTLVGTQTIATDVSGAGQSFTYTIFALDPISNVSGAQYCLTVTPTGTGCTIKRALIQSMVLSG